MIRTVILALLCPLLVALIVVRINVHLQKAKFTVKLIIPKIRNLYQIGSKPTKPFIEIHINNRSSNNIFFEYIEYVHHCQPNQFHIDKILVPKFSKAKGFFYGEGIIPKFTEEMTSLTFRSNYNREVTVKNRKLKRVIKQLSKALGEYEEDLIEYKRVMFDTKMNRLNIRG